MTMQQDIAELIDSLKRERDELNLQAHLLKAQAHDEWLELEKQWPHLEHKAKAATTAAELAAGDVAAALDLLGEEVRAGYRRIRDALKSA